MYCTVCKSTIPWTFIAVGYMDDGKRVMKGDGYNEDSSIAVIHHIQNDGGDW